MKQKIKNSKIKENVFLFPVESHLTNEEEPKVKLKKKVPQIRT